jgi:hypothetical protein
MDDYNKETFLDEQDNKSLAVAYSEESSYAGDYSIGFG